MDKIVELHCLKHKYPDKTEISICGLDFIVNQGERIALIGPNGVGKTTLLLHLLGLLQPTEGLVKVFGVNPSKELSKIGQKIGVVVQNAEEQLMGPTVYDDIMFSLVNYGISDREARNRADKIIKELKIEYLKEKIVHYLSGGEKRKVALAGALVLEPELLILDEALAELDPEGIDIALKKILELNEKNKTAVILATNDTSLIQRFAEIVYVLEKGKIVFKGSFKELLDFKGRIKN